MTDASTQDGVTFAVLERFERFRLPRPVDIKAKVDCSEQLDGFDLGYLEEVLADGKKDQALC